MRYRPLACAVCTIVLDREALLHGADSPGLGELGVVGEKAEIVLEIQDDAVQSLGLEEVEVRLETLARAQKEET